MITQLEQAARLALEALETVIWAQDHQEDHWPVAIEHTRQAFLKLSDALNKTSFNPEIIYDEQEMLRLCPHFGPSPARDEWISGYEAAITALLAALEQPAQDEPVAKVVSTSRTDNGFRAVVETGNELLDLDTPLYTSPQAREPLEGVIDVQPIGYHSLQLIFRSQTDIAKFKAAHGIGEKQ